MIDGATNTVTAQVPYGAGAIGSGGIAVDTGTHTVYASTQDKLLVISGASNTVTGTVSTADNGSSGAYSAGAQIVTDSSRHLVYSAHRGNDIGVVDVIDGNTNASKNNVGGPGVVPGPIAVDAGPSTLYLSNVRLRAVVAYPIVDRRLSDGPVEIISTDADALGIAVNPTTHAVYTLGNNRANAGELNIINGPAGPEVNSQASQLTQFEGGDIYYTPAAGAHVVKGVIEARWKMIRAELGVLGMPISDELTTPDGVGRYNRFEHGSIYYGSATGAHEIYGAIAQRWADEGFERSPYGYPPALSSASAVNSCSARTHFMRRSSNAESSSGRSSTGTSRSTGELRSRLTCVACGYCSPAQPVSSADTSGQR